MKSIICGVVLAALVSPALADEYWVEYNYSTQKCSIVQKKSDAANVTTISSDTLASTGDYNFDPTAALIAWAGKRDVAEAARLDAEKTTLGTAIQTPDQAVTEMKMKVVTAIYTIWAREKATSEAARSDAAKALIGTVSESREGAEKRMNIMRKCGLNP